MRVRSMFGFFFSILVVIVLISWGSELVMRIRVTRMEPHDKIAWWRRGGDEVEAVYEELFPKSRLPLFRRFGFGAVIAVAAAMLLAFLWKSK